MKILIDECLPKKLKTILNQYEAYTVQDMNWAGIMKSQKITFYLILIITLFFCNLIIADNIQSNLSPKSSKSQLGKLFKCWDQFSDHFVYKKKYYKWSLNKKLTLKCYFKIHGADDDMISLAFNRMPIDKKLDDQIPMSLGRIMITPSIINNKFSFLIRIQPTKTSSYLYPNDLQKSCQSWYDEVYKIIFKIMKIYGFQNMYAIPHEHLLKTEGKYKKWSKWVQNRNLVLPFNEWSKKNIIPTFTTFDWELENYKYYFLHQYNPKQETNKTLDWVLNRLPKIGSLFKTQSA